MPGVGVKAASQILLPAGVFSAFQSAGHFRARRESPDDGAVRDIESRSVPFASRQQTVDERVVPLDMGGFIS